MPPTLLPRPRQLEWAGGTFPLAGPGTPAPAGAGELRRLLPTEAFAIITPGEAAAAPAADAREEYYELTVAADRVCARALTPEGLLRAEATLLQLLARGPEGLHLPCCRIVDWPLFRYRCASDWLLNCEINRWGYDWGDGCEAYLARIKRKLDFCFTYKINQVWFDGFGWSLSRRPGYAELMRECNRYARERGIRLTFAGYGGGYGTSYQKSELYRCGYQGQVFTNRRPWPDGEEYDCTGCDVPESRHYGTCPSNEGLKAAKLRELTAFVAAVEPGLVYVHDVDTGTWEASVKSWRWRCEECRRRWPSDEMADPAGQAAAYAQWFGELEQALHAVTTDGGYDAARDLTIVFTSPVYTTYEEAGQPELWETEVEYFRVLSELLGPRRNVAFGFREQFYRADGSRKIAHLRETLDQVGHGHQAHVIAFGGGDNYSSDDLCNLSGAVAPLYEGAASVCLSNGAVHEEPVQAINAGFLWNGEVEGFAVDPGEAAAFAETYMQMRLGRWRPAELYAEGALLDRTCRHLWGQEAGAAMFRAYRCGGDSGLGPVSRVWWSVTREVQRLTTGRSQWNDRLGPEALARRWQDRREATAQALAHAREAVAANDCEDLQWFARCLRVGLGFASALAELYRWQHTGEEAARTAGEAHLQDLAQHLAAEHRFDFCDLLGGDPGAWLESLQALQTWLAATPATLGETAP